jgi:hypothetical protein
MTEREKELEELKEIIEKSKKTCEDLRFHEKNNLKFSPKDAVYAPNENEFIAENIQQAGYTKTHFPIEKLEAWLRETYPCEYIVFNNILKKIAELKEG